MPAYTVIYDERGMVVTHSTGIVCIYGLQDIADLLEHIILDIMRLNKIKNSMDDIYSQIETATTTPK